MYGHIKKISWLLIVMLSVAKHLRSNLKKRFFSLRAQNDRLLFIISIYFLIFLGGAHSQAKADKIFEIKGLKKTEESTSARKTEDRSNKEFRSQVSQKNLLRLKRTSKYSLPAGKLLPLEYYSSVETLNVLAIRVEFQKEVPDDPKTTGDGLFDRRTYQQYYIDEGSIIDPAPHYRKYFLAHLRALNNYWNTVSGGKLVLKYEVYPLEESLTYQLPHTISYYGDTGLPDYPFDGLKRFFEDSFQLADSLPPGIDFSKYNCFIIFHAGSDRQSDLGSFVSTYTPNDLFTGFIITGDTVWVDQGSFPITEGMIMPETRTQDGRIGALNAVFAHEFGHQLGLPDFYNTRTFTTQIGDFSLMDNNAMDVGIDLDSCKSPASGLLPVYPDAWGRAYLGYTEPAEITNQNNVKLLAAEMLKDSMTQSAKVPINSQEYFLIENRQIDIDHQPSYLLGDSSTGVVLGPVRVENDVKVPNREYDYLLPGSGILIWHIDEGVAYLDYDDDGFDNFADNKLQWDKDRRFITLEEADGIIDFGGNYYAGYGSQEDMYYLGNNSSFTPYTFPSSRSNNRSETHIFVTGIGFSGITMNFNLKNDIVLSGWPQRMKSDLNNSSLVYGDLDGDGKKEVLTSSGKYVYAWRTDGSKFMPNSDSIGILELDGKYGFHPLAIFAEAETTIFGTPSLGHLKGYDSLEVVAGDLSGKVYVWKGSDADSNGRADLLFDTITMGDQISMTPVISNFKGDSSLEIFAGAKDGSWAIISNTGVKINSGSYSEKVVGLASSDLDTVNFVLTENNQSGHLRRMDDTVTVWIKDIPSKDNFPPVVGDINRDGKPEVIVLSGDGKVYVWDVDGNTLSGFPVLVGDISSGPVLADIDGDGYLEIIFCGDNKVYAYSYNGVITTNFPMILDNASTAGAIQSTPILADLDGDGKVEIVFGLKDGRIIALHGSGSRFTDFPLALSGEVLSSGIVLDDSVNQVNGYVKRNLFFKTEDGLVYGFYLDFVNSAWKEKTPWLMAGYNSGHTNSFPQALLPDIPRYAEVMPGKSVYNYPNPAKDQTTIRYFLSQDASVKIRIYDLSGDLIAEDSQMGKANSENEYLWDCSRYASGVYLCRVEAESNSGKNVAFCKIALVK